MNSRCLPESRLEALAYVAHGDRNIYPANAPPPAPKATHPTLPIRRLTLIGTGKAGPKMSQTEPSQSPTRIGHIPDTSHLRCCVMMDSEEVSGRTRMCEACGREKDKDKDKDKVGLGWECRSESEVEDKEGEDGLDVEIEGASTGG
ncbi:hypothetical protein RSOLAG22IIIB_05681 [Rhizoctonia solani]|uniref:Uncharacterized protein n=1 Tax=Rhizoctonia solani TaxID=456999 RepID=A0A0K6G7X8_9AGAM|nr:hypothetical protein RSOLAG22IIIB_05681 [Rhizoctonia solani]